MVKVKRKSARAKSIEQRERRNAQMMTVCDPIEESQTASCSSDAQSKRRNAQRKTVCDPIEESQTASCSSDAQSKRRNAQRMPDCDPIEEAQTGPCNNATVQDVSSIIITQQTVSGGASCYHPVCDPIEEAQTGPCNNDTVHNVSSIIITQQTVSGDPSCSRFPQGHAEPEHTMLNVEDLPRSTRQGAKRRIQHYQLYGDAQNAAKKAKYRANEKYRQNKKGDSTGKYAVDPKHKETVKAGSIRKYATDPTHKETVKAGSIRKYANDPTHKEAVKAASSQQYPTSAKHRETVKAGSIRKYADDPKHREKVKRTASAKRQTRKQSSQNIDVAINEFREACKQGPEYVCCSCKRLLFHDQVLKYKESYIPTEELALCISRDYLHECTDTCGVPCLVKSGPQGKLWLCYTCKSHFKKEEMPPQNFRNGLQPEPVPEPLAKLNTLEQQLISLNLPFMKIVPRSAGGQPGVKGPCILVPANVEKTRTSLPRPMSQSQIVGVKLKRKLEYKGHVAFKMVNVFDVNAALGCLKEINPLYAKVQVDANWQNHDVDSADLQSLVEEQETDPGARPISEVHVEHLHSLVGEQDTDPGARPISEVHVEDLHSLVGEQETDPGARPICEVHVEDDIVLNVNSSDSGPTETTTGSNIEEDELEELNTWGVGEQETDPGARPISQVHVEDDIVLNVNSSDSGPNPLMETTTDSDHEEDERDQLRGLGHDSCLQPIDLEGDVLADLENHIFSVAPAEGNKPISMFTDAMGEAKSFPSLFPSGINTYDEDREKRLTRSKYMDVRLMSADRRFTQTNYIFYALFSIELDQLISGISISMRKGAVHGVNAGQLSNKEELYSMMKKDEGFRYLQALRGSPEYWRTTMNDLFAMIRQLGLPTWFCTFSAAELSRWPETIEAIVRNTGHTVDFDSLEWAEKCDILRSDPVTAVRMFDHRVNAFLSKVIRSPANPIGKVVEFFYRVEFQQRGAPHIHCLFWIENAPIFDKATDEEVCEYVDGYISCTLPDAEAAPELHEIVSSVQMHRKKHTQSCKKGKKECRFSFPRPIAPDTFVVRPDGAQVDVDDSGEENLSGKKARQFLEKMSTILSDDEKLPNMTSEEVILESGFASFRQMQEAMRKIAKKPSIVMKRNTQDVWVNNYNPDLLLAWNANMDIQYILDPYSCIMYILSYISKSEHELGDILKQARQELKEEGNMDLKKQILRLLVDTIWVNDQTMMARIDGVIPSEVDIMEISFVSPLTRR